MRFLLLIFTLIITGVPVFAACTPLHLTTQHKNFVLSTETPQVYFFKNTTHNALWLDHPVKRSLNAGWSSYIRAGNWSALMLDRKNFEISCATIQPGVVNELDCSTVIEVCSSEASLPKKLKGTFWLAEDKSWDDLMKAIAKRDVVIKEK